MWNDHPRPSEMRGVVEKFTFGQMPANKHENQFTLVFNDFRSTASLKNLPK